MRSKRATVQELQGFKEGLENCCSAPQGNKQRAARQSGHAEAYDKPSKESGRGLELTSASTNGNMATLS
jgi:hypothetical protein